MKVEPMTEKDLLEWHEELIKKLPDLVSSINGCPNFVVILTRMMNVPEHIRQFSTELKEFTGENANRYVEVLMPIEYENPTKLVDYMIIAMPNQGRDHPVNRERQLAYLEGKKHGVPEKAVDEGIVQIVMKGAGGVKKKDIAASFLKYVCKQLEAEAILKFDEIWTLKDGTDKETVKRAVADGNLKDHPDRIEGLLGVLETPNLIKMSMIPMVREQLGSGKIVSFGERKDTVARAGEKSEIRVGGRFVGLLPNSPFGKITPLDIMDGVAKEASPGE